MTFKAMLLASTMLLGGGTLAFAQTNAQPMAPAPQVTGSPATTPMISPMSPAARNPGVNPSAAGTQMGNSDATATPAVGTPGTGTPGSGMAGNASAATADTGGLHPGANSFTQGQARRRIQNHGFTQVTQLHKDKNSIWQGMAMKDGRKVHVGLDYQGNVAEQP